MIKFVCALLAASTASATGLRAQIQVNTLNQVITELDILEKAKLNT